ncbi:MAG: filamentous hemagglutinin N-terminal domain-containing protein, partial [Planctomycetota bacterium]
MVSALALGGAVSMSLAGPEGAQVVHGSASINTQGALTTIRTSDTAIINYSGFDILPTETVRFIQPSASSRVLNRIQSADPTVIAGRLQANGQVYITNRAGVYFANGALVDAGTIYAAAGSISNADFLANINRFTDLTGDVVNEGTLRADAVHLLGQRVINSGQIDAKGGLVSMFAGDSVLIGERGGRIYAKVDASRLDNPIDPAAVGTGDLYSIAIMDTAGIQALHTHVESAGRTEVAGNIDASNPAGVGGTIDLFGSSVVVRDAMLDASGSAGGGSVRIGGGLQGRDASAPNAKTTLVTPGTRISADGFVSTPGGVVGSGDGGTVILWADQTAGFGGNITARAGGDGDGGFVEVSGRERLIYQGAVDTRATNGNDGTLLLDPENVRVVEDADADTTDLTDVDAFDDPDLSSFETTIAVSSINNATSNVEVQAEDEVSIEAAIDIAEQGVGFTARAGGNIFVDAPITTNDGDVTLSANDAMASEPSLIGNITINEPIRTTGGDLTLTVNPSNDGDGDIAINALLDLSRDFGMPSERGGLAVIEASGGGFGDPANFSDDDFSISIGDGLALTAGRSLFFGPVELGRNTRITGVGGGSAVAFNEDVLLRSATTLRVGEVDLLGGPSSVGNFESATSFLIIETPGLSDPIALGGGLETSALDFTLSDLAAVSGPVVVSFGRDSGSSVLTIPATVIDTDARLRLLGSGQAVIPNGLTLAATELTVPTVEYGGALDLSVSSRLMVNSFTATADGLPVTIASTNDVGQATVQVLGVGGVAFSTRGGSLQLQANGESSAEFGVGSIDTDGGAVEISANDTALPISIFGDIDTRMADGGAGSVAITGTNALVLFDSISPASDIDVFASQVVIDGAASIFLEPTSISVVPNGTVELDAATLFDGLSIIADEVNFVGGAESVFGAGQQLSIAPTGDNVPIVLGGNLDQPGQLDLSLSDVQALTRVDLSAGDTPLMLELGRAGTGAHSITVGDFSPFTTSVLGAGLTLHAPAGQITLSNNLVTDGSQVFNGPVTFTDASTGGNGATVFSLGGTVDFNGPVTGTGAGGSFSAMALGNVTIGAGSSIDVNGGDVMLLAGASEGLSTSDPSVIISGPIATNGGSLEVRATNESSTQLHNGSVQVNAGIDLSTSSGDRAGVARFRAPLASGPGFVVSLNSPEGVAAGRLVFETPVTITVPQELRGVGTASVIGFADSVVATPSADRLTLTAGEIVFGGGAGSFTASRLRVQPVADTTAINIGSN